MERLGLPGRRRSYYRLRPGAWSELFIAKLRFAAEEVSDMSDEARVQEVRAALARPVVFTLPGMEEVAVTRDLPYRTLDDGSTLRMDVYRPAGEPGPRPAAVFVHGGPIPEVLADRPTREIGAFLSHGRLAAASGLIGVTFDYRYPDLDTLPRGLGDVRAAIGHLRQRGELGIDPDRLALWLFSGAGLHLPALLADPPPGVRCAVAYYTVMEMGVMAAFGSPVPVDAPPIPGLDGVRPLPLFVARAGKDHPALDEALDRFVLDALRHGFPLELHHHPEGPHGFDVLTDDDASRRIVRRTYRFLCEHLLDEASADS